MNSVEIFTLLIQKVIAYKREEANKPEVCPCGGNCREYEKDDLLISLQMLALMAPTIDRMASQGEETRIADFIQAAMLLPWTIRGNAEDVLPRFKELSNEYLTDVKFAEFRTDYEQDSTR